MNRRSRHRFRSVPRRMCYADMSVRNLPKLRRGTRYSPNMHNRTPLFPSRAYRKPSDRAFPLRKTPEELASPPANAAGPVHTQKATYERTILRPTSSCAATAKGHPGGAEVHPDFSIRWRVAGTRRGAALQ